MNAPNDRRIAWILACIAAALMWPVRNCGLVMNDDGILLQAANRILSGQVPGVDFPVLHPPGFPTLIAAALEVGGGSWIAYRILLIAMRALSAGLLYGTLRRIGGRGPCAIATLGTILVPGYWHKTPVFLVVIFITWCALRWWERPDRTRLVAFGAGCGLAALFRLDMAVVAGGLATVVLCLPSGPENAGGRTKRLAVIVGSALVPFLGLHAVIGVGPLHFLELPLALISEPATHRLSSPYPGLGTWATMAVGDPGALKLLLYHWVPWVALVVIGRSIALKRAGWSAWDLTARLLVVGATVTLLHQVFWISNYGHLLQATPMILALAILDGTACWRGEGVRSRALALSLIVPWITFVSFNFFFCDDPSTGSPWFLSQTMTHEVETALGPIRVEKNRAEALSAILAEVRSHGDDETPMFVFPMMSLYYGLTGRPNPTTLDALNHATYRSSLRDSAAEDAFARAIIDAGTDPLLLDEPVSFLGIIREPDQRMSHYAHGLLSELTDHYEIATISGTTLILRPRASAPDQSHRLDRPSSAP